MVDAVNTYEESVEDGQHTLNMLEKAERLENPNVSDRPEWLPEKFDSVEDMASAYTSLEQKMGSQDEQEEEQEEELEEGGVEEIANELEERGVDFDALSDEFMEHGGLTEESYEALLEAGIPRNMVDQLGRRTQWYAMYREDTPSPEVCGSEPDVSAASSPSTRLPLSSRP